MNRKYIILNTLILVFILTNAGWAMTIADLLDAAASHPGAQVTELGIQESQMNRQSVTDELYPKLSLFGRAEWYNSPTNLRPMPPTEVNVQAGDSLPFSETIFRYGIELKMPVYAKKLYVLREKLKLMTENAEIVNRINLSTRQARVVSMNSSFQYLTEVDRAVSARMRSLEQTQKDVRLKVANGRLPETEWVKINNSLIELSQQKIELEAKLLDLKQNLKKLTGLDVSAPVDMTIIDSVESGNTFIEVKKNQILLEAARKEVSLRRAEYFPVVSLYGKLSGNDGEAYNTDDPIHRDYHTAGLVIQIPIFEKSMYTRKNLAEIKVKKAEKKLEDMKIQLQAQAEKLEKMLPIIDRSIELARQSVKNNEQLLKVAKIAFNSGRETTEEYLRYETQLLGSQAAVRKAVDQKWQVVAQQTILYGIDLKGVVQ